MDKPEVPLKRRLVIGKSKPRDPERKLQVGKKENGAHGSSSRYRFTSAAWHAPPTFSPEVSTSASGVGEAELMRKSPLTYGLAMVLPSYQAHLTVGSLASSPPRWRRRDEVMRAKQHKNTGDREGGGETLGLGWRGAGAHVFRSVGVIGDKEITRPFERLSQSPLRWRNGATSHQRVIRENPKMQRGNWLAARDVGWLMV
ncbi:hypothetical protein BD779DRAFT_1472260 [Infundibulicybe gibba]|nr:hypothetical protein BD779DRAFT_1472260 [Infundibulicybe gibba]